ncbi:10910_t:CDS:2, partial [Gigaspora rosea]
QLEISGTTENDEAPTYDKTNIQHQDINLVVTNQQILKGKHTSDYDAKLMPTSEIKRYLHAAKTPAYDEGTKYANPSIQRLQTTSPTYNERKKTC